MENNASENVAMVAFIPPELEELVPWFVGNMREKLEQMRQALQEGDLETARMIGHDMKGVGRSYGFDGISQIGEKVEYAAIEKDTEELDRNWEVFADYIEKVKIVVLKD